MEAEESNRPPDDNNPRFLQFQSRNRRRSQRNNRLNLPNQAGGEGSSTNVPPTTSNRQQDQQYGSSTGNESSDRPRRPPRRPLGQVQNQRKSELPQHTDGLMQELNDPSATASQTASGPSFRPRRRNNPRGAKPWHDAASEISTPYTITPDGTSALGSGLGMTANAPPQPKPRQRNNRRANFGAALTEGTTDSATTGPGTPDPESSLLLKPSERYKPKSHSNKGSGGGRRPSPPPEADDLTSTLIRSLSTPPFPDCPICFNSIHPAQPTWSCSPSTPVVVNTAQGEEVQYCWTIFHVKCIRSWANKSVKEISEAWRARGEERVGDWRCPGCQAKREIVPSGYWCFCQSLQEPQLTRLATPHSCGSPCARVRESGCGHPCPLRCHPGPCPPCQVTTRHECYCPRKKVMAFRCGSYKERDQGKGPSARNLSCGEVCGKSLNCDKHKCERICHDGDCGKCTINEIARCYCGKDEQEMKCGEGEEKDCVVEDETMWIGRFTCSQKCKRLFDCGIHKCQKTCHVPSVMAAPCPFSPSVIETCPCGKTPISPHGAAAAPGISTSNTTSEDVFPERRTCSDPIPTCTSRCSKVHSFCGHECEEKCHTGPCSPCTTMLARPCRCGTTTKSIRCYELLSTEDGVEKEIFCEKPCMALRACGRHQCRRICCPLASLAFGPGAGKKGKKKAGAGNATSGANTLGMEGIPGIGEEKGGLHECDLVCGRLLSCGNHVCEEKDHKGPCPRCLRSSFEEMICFCGLTVLEPPIPCGTVMLCKYPCPRPPPPCGHPRIPHTCHEDPSPCPPCVVLTSKACACGKKVVMNVKCSLETNKVSCGTVCGKLMKCGFHHCERLCHADDCGDCTLVCGKSRKSCLPSHHPCPHPCHAPASCPEDKPCQSLISVTCPCGRIRQSIHCGKSASNTNGREHAQPKCTNECGIAKRNARLADALGISLDKRGEAGTTATYTDELVAFARSNAKFLGIVERAFSEFVTSEKRTQVLPHMPPERRKVVHDLATVYRMDTQMVDQEPHRSVRLLRRIDTRLPSPLLSAHLASLNSTPNLGKLADLRNPNGGLGLSWRPQGMTTPPFAMNLAVLGGGNMNGAAVGGLPSRPGSGSGTPRGWAPVPNAAASAGSSGPGTRQTVGGGGSSAAGSGGMKPSTTSTRTSTPPRASVVLPVVAMEVEDVPDNWEDDDV